MKKWQVELSDASAFIKKIKNDSVDLTLTSPPYCIGKKYDTHFDLDGFREINSPVIKQLIQKTKPGGSICWQVGFFVHNGEITPLDFIIYELFKAAAPDIKLRNRIIWHFEHGANCSKRFSGRHETILWFTKGDDYYFDLDAVRVPQKYPGKKYYKGHKKGQFSGNPLGKNPGDVWVIPNVNATHIEKTTHPCQFPIGLVQRVVRSLSPKLGLVLDPFMGSGSTGAGALIEGRKFLGCDTERSYVKTATERLELAAAGLLGYRDISKPIYDPKQAGSVASTPTHFKFFGSEEATH